MSFTESEHTALHTIAQRQRVPVSKLRAQIARSHLALEHADPPAHPEAPAAAEPDLPSVASEEPKLGVEEVDALGGAVPQALLAASPQGAGAEELLGPVGQVPDGAGCRSVVRAAP